MQVAETPRSEDVRRAAEEIVNRPEFIGSQAEKTMMEALSERLGEWFGGLGEWAEASPDGARMLTIALIVVLLALIGHALYTFFSEIARNTSHSRKAGSGAQASVTALEGVADDWEDAWRLARAALDAGDLRRALWIAHRLLLSALDDRGLIAFRKWKTNAHYLRECAAENDHAALLRDLTQLYERAVYAHETRLAADSAVSLMDRVERYGAGA